ncbi:MAG TPA: hypothetical protein VFE62_19305 [Gemmataceae bacterium]|nr:hypothetical protein [Gemmataceae bacterium]
MKFPLQYASEKSIVKVGNQSIEVKAYQIVLWMSISGPATTSLSVKVLKFPAILDTGTTHNFFLTVDQLQRWARIPVSGLKQKGNIRLQGTKAPLFDATLWLRGEEEEYWLTTNDGIAVFEGDWPRLPILGLRALTNSELQVLIYGNTKRAIVRTPPPWYWPF